MRLRADTQLTGTDALDDLGCGARGTGQVLYSDCDWAALPAGVVFDIHDDVTQSATIANADRMPFSDENSSGDPMRYTSASNFAAYVRGTIPAGAVFDIHDNLTSATIADADRLAFSDEGSAGDPMRYITATNLANYIQTEAGETFDIHDDVTQGALIADTDRIVFSDEGSAGDPMRYAAAENLADYMQVEVELSANRVTRGTFNTARIPNLPASRTTSGTFQTARIPNLSASNTTSGTFGTARIPNLPASKTTSGTFNTARIPNLSAAKNHQWDLTQRAAVRDPNRELGE